MMNDEEFGILVDGYCRKIKRICDEIVYIDNNKVLDKVSEIIKLANRAQQIKSMREECETQIEFGWIMRGLKPGTYGIEELCGEDEE